VYIYGAFVKDDADGELKVTWKHTSRRALKPYTIYKY